MHAGVCLYLHDTGKRHKFNFWQLHSENIRDHCGSASGQVNGKYDNVLSFWIFTFKSFMQLQTCYYIT